MHSRLIVILNQRERDALQSIAARELRGLSQQAQYLLRRELQREGLLSPVDGQAIARHRAKGQTGRRSSDERRV